MPYASTSDLPADVRAALPDAAQALFLRVHTASINAGDPDAEALRIAWRGLGNAGWVKGTDGVYAQAAPKRLAVAKRAGTADSYTLRVPVTKLDGTDDEVEVSGWASVALDPSGAVIVDHDNEIIPVPVLRAAAAKFLAQSREFNAVDHYEAPCGHLVESVVMTPATRVAMGLPGDGPTGWWVTAKIRGPAAKRVRSGELREFSIEATALKQRNADNTITFRDLHVDRITLVDAGAGIGVRIESIKRLGGSMNMDQILAKLGGVLSPEEMKILESALAAAKAPPPEAEAMKAQVEAAKAGEAAAKKRLAEIEAEIAMTPEQREEAANKRLDPEVLKLRSEVAKMRGADETRRYADEAKSYAAVPNLSLDAIARVLRTADTVVSKDATAPKHGDDVRTFLAAAAKVSSESALFRNIGGQPPPDSGSAQAELDAKARAICTRDEDLKRLPVEKALKIAKGRAMDENGALYDRVQAERSAAAKN